MVYIRVFFAHDISGFVNGLPNLKSQMFVEGNCFFVFDEHIQHYRRMDGGTALLQDLRPNATILIFRKNIQIVNFVFSVFPLVEMVIANFFTVLIDCGVFFNGLFEFPMDPFQHFVIIDAFKILVIRNELLAEPKNRLNISRGRPLVRYHIPIPISSAVMQRIALKRRLQRNGISLQNCNISAQILFHSLRSGQCMIQIVLSIRI